eukprot:SAG31_NODE_2850_length_4998_cov_3.096346_3_plen_57_part_00
MELTRDLFDVQVSYGITNRPSLRSHHRQMRLLHRLHLRHHRQRRRLRQSPAIHRIG